MGKIEHWFGAVFVAILALVAVLLWLSPSAPGAKPNRTPRSLETLAQINPQHPREAYCQCFNRAKKDSRSKAYGMTSYQYDGGLLLCSKFRVFEDDMMGIHAWTKGWEAGMGNQKNGAPKSCGRAYGNFLRLRDQNRN